MSTCLSPLIITATPSSFIYLLYSLVVYRYENRQTLLFSYERYIYFWLRFFDTRRETQFLKVFRNHTMLTPPPISGTYHCVLHLNSSLPVEIRKTQLFDSMAKSPTLDSMVQCQPSTDSFSKSPNFLFRVWCHPHSSPISSLGVYYDNGDCHSLCVRA